MSRKETRKHEMNKMNSKTKTEMETGEVGVIKDTEVNEWSNARSIAQERNARKRALRKTLNVVVKHNTPIEQVCLQMVSVIDDVFSVTQAPAIMGKLGNCTPVKLTAGITLPTDIYALYKSAKASYDKGEVTLADVCVLTEKGVKMDKYAFSFRVIK